MSQNQEQNQNQSQEIVGTELNVIGQKLNLIYNHFMLLKIFIDSEDEQLHQLYRESVEKHNAKIAKNPEMIDAGFDLFTPLQNQVNQVKDDKIRLPIYQTKPHTLDFKVVCSAHMVTDLDIESQEESLYNTGFDMRPRSSLSNTNLRLANSVGTIDAGYRGHLMGKFDLLHHLTFETPSLGGANTENDEKDDYYTLDQYVRLVQICAPGLLPILVRIVSTKEELGSTARGSGGFGSTGK